MKLETKKNIVLLSPFFYPENISTGKYNTSLVEALTNEQVSIQVICSHPLYPNWKPIKSSAVLPGMTIQRGGHKILYPKQVILRRLVLELWFSFYAMTKIFRKRNEIDILIAVFPPTLFMFFLKLVLPKKIKTIGIIHDLLGVMATSHNSVLRKVLSKVIKYAEIASFNVCDKLVCLSESMRDTVSKQYQISPQKLVVRYPFVSTNSDMSRSNNLSQIFPTGYSHIVYSGALGEKQIPNVLLEFYQKLCANNDKIMCHIFSRGPVYNELAKNKNLRFPDRILFHDLVDEKDLAELFEKSTVQIIPQATGTGAGAFPSKLPNLLAAGVPVFAICDQESELGKLVAVSGTGYVINEWHMDSWVSGLEELLIKSAGETHRERQIKTKEMIAKMFSVQSLVKTIMRMN